MIRNEAVVAYYNVSGVTEENTEETQTISSMSRLGFELGTILIQVTMFTARAKILDPP
jgi:hypothetical protein